MHTPSLNEVQSSSADCHMIITKLIQGGFVNKSLREEGITVTLKIFVVSPVVLVAPTLANAESKNYAVANVLCYMPVTGSQWMSSNPCRSSQGSFSARNEFEAKFWDYAMKYVWKKVDRAREPDKEETKIFAVSSYSSVYRYDRAQAPISDVNYNLRVSSKRALVKLSYDFY